MNLLAILIIISIPLTKVLAIGYRQCLVSTDTSEIANLKCDRDVFNCSHIPDKTKVKVIRYECSSFGGTLQMDWKDLGNFSNVKIIDISSLQLQRVNVVFTNKANSITALNVSHNLFTAIPSAIFKMAPNLLEIDFSYNNIGTIRINDFTGINKISSINCSHNQINTLPKRTFGHLHLLKTLDLRENRIVYIEADMFVNNSNLKVLDLTNNPLKMFDFNVLSKPVNVRLPFESIEALNVSCQPDCQFEGFNEGDFFPNLRFLNASKSRVDISQLLEAFGMTLKVLDLSWTFVGSITCNMFQRFVHLNELHLSDASISNIETNALANHTQLKSLDLSGNDLFKVNSSIFPQFAPALQTLHLEHNNLAQIDGIVPEKFPNLMAFVISGNQFSCKVLRNLFDAWKNATNIQFTSEQSTYQTNINGVECKCDGTVVNLIVNKTVSTLPYIIAIVILIAVSLSMAIVVVVCFVKKHEQKELSVGFIKANAEAQTGDAIDLGIGSLYEEIDLNNVTFQNDVDDIQNRPLPMPSDQHYAQIRSIAPSTHYLYAHVFKRDFS